MIHNNPNLHFFFSVLALMLFLCWHSAKTELLRRLCVFWRYVNKKSVLLSPLFMCSALLASAKALLRKGIDLRGIEDRASETKLPCVCLPGLNMDVNQRICMRVSLCVFAGKMLKSQDSHFCPLTHTHVSNPGEEQPLPGLCWGSGC